MTTKKPKKPGQGKCHEIEDGQYCGRQSTRRSQEQAGKPDDERCALHGG